ncbi:hypothetical protein ACFOOK_28195 [Micromonospora krabiensis]|uniref:Uncharacterized protein n=1 Tax=Micromonospora krabiensis TaxID=307121 RepID=A0A1C3N4N5_9ACTN|nr:hypothetical protein [Micromonospora krabiensis]SBV27550.1 hypothetical protein GA0070620_3074 [Micromonospora krabiensis]
MTTTYAPRKCRYCLKMREAGSFVSTGPGARIRHPERRIYLNSYGTAGQTT